jgi:hypothetical protein
MRQSAVRFTPWVGNHYVQGFQGLRVLLVCESHYGAKLHERPTVTPEIVKALALGERHLRATARLPRHPHFAKIMAALTNVRNRFSLAQKETFWGSVAYYNFLQEFLSKPRESPSPHLWEQGASAFTEVMDVLSPELIVCFSKRNGHLIRSLAGDVPIAVVNHPSSRFAYAKVIPVIASAIETALMQKLDSPGFSCSAVFDRWQKASASAQPTPGKHLSEPDRIWLLEQRRESMARADEG